MAPKARLFRRRGFIKRLSLATMSFIALSSWLFMRSRSGRNVSDQPRPEDHRRIEKALKVMVAATLPLEVPEEERERAVKGFVEWLKGYRPNVQRIQYNGYRYTVNKVTAPHPTKKFQEEIDDLEYGAYRRYKRPFGDLSRADQQFVLRRALNESGDQSELHLIAQFLEYYFTNDDGVNRVRRVNISPRTCRGWNIESAPESIPH